MVDSQPAVQSRKLSFDLQYALSVQLQQSSQQLPLSRQISQEVGNVKSQLGAGAMGQPAPQQSGEQLKQLLDKLKPHDTIIWKNVDNKYQDPRHGQQ